MITFDDVTDRRRAEAALHESENGFRRIVETANEGIWQVDADSRTSFVNRRMAEMLGYTPEELLGRRPSDFVVDEERPDVERRMAISRQGLPDSYERRFLRKDGSEVWTLLKSSPVRSPDGALAGLLAMVSDITERKGSDEAIRRSEENLRSYFEAFDDCVFVLDGEGAILHVNRIVTTRLGWEPHELVGRSVLEVHPEERREEAARIVAAMLAGKARSCPVPLLTKNGKRIPVETRVFPGRWDGRDVLFGLSKDLSQLRASEEKFQKAFRHNPSPMVIRSIPTGKIIDVNEAFTETLGYPREAVVGKTFREIGATIDLARQAAAEELVRANGSFRDFEMDARTADGRILHGLFSGEVIELQDERLLPARHEGRHPAPGRRGRAPAAPRAPRGARGRSHRHALPHRGRAPDALLRARAAGRGEDEGARKRNRLHTGR
ncbi:MAG: PAS domain S-box protein [Holophagales bacterium]|nr:PAS domain S-box protein [Holophagales bacterium]